MNIADFVNKYTNTKVDFDGAYGAQCVDLFRQYCKDVLQIPHTGAVEGAKDLFLKYPDMDTEKKYFNRYAYPNLKCGDVAVWDATKTNKYGHVAIVLSDIDFRSVLVFEQNGFTQDGAKINIRNKTNMLGILRRKNV